MKVVIFLVLSQNTEPNNAAVNLHILPLYSLWKEELHALDRHLGAAVFEGGGVHGAHAALRDHGIGVCRGGNALKPGVLEAADRRGLDQLALLCRAALVLRALHGVFLRQGRKVAFDIDRTGAFKDLPNRNLSAGGIISIRKKGAIYEVTFNAPVGLNRPAGTAVRQHENAPPYIYLGAAGAQIQKDWKEFSGTIGKELKFGVNPGNRWWRGTRSVKLVLLVNYAGDNSQKSLLKEVKLQKIERK